MTYQSASGAGAKQIAGINRTKRLYQSAFIPLMN